MEPILDLNEPNLASSSPLSRDQFLRVGLWFTLALWLAAVLLPPVVGRPGIWPALRFSGLFTWRTLLSGLLGLVIGAVVTILMLYTYPLRVVAERLAGILPSTLHPSDYVIIALMAALGEEPLFRGALQPLIGLVPTAVIFGLLHATSITHVALATLLGLLLGWLYRWSASLWPPIAAHLIIDLVTGLLMARALAAPGTSGD